MAIAALRQFRDINTITMINNIVADRNMMIERNATRGLTSVILLASNARIGNMAKKRGCNIRRLIKCVFAQEQLRTNHTDALFIDKETLGTMLELAPYLTVG